MWQAAQLLCVQHWRSYRISSPFVECSGAFLCEHTQCTVDGTAILPMCRVHVPRLDDIDGWGGHCGAEPCDQSRGEVTRDRVPHQAMLYEKILDDVVAHNLTHVHNCIPAHVREGSWNVSGAANSSTRYLLQNKLFGLQVQYSTDTEVLNKTINCKTKGESC